MTATDPDEARGQDAGNRRRTSGGGTPVGGPAPLGRPGGRGGDLGIDAGRAPAGARPEPGSAGEVRMTVPPLPADAARVSCFLANHLRWSAYWDKKYGLWRVAEDDPDSDLYAESSDAGTVISYISAHS
jgi:hypothetical protein